MKNNETGEFELVLGNRQLLSGFFVVVILFAVFFVMGYFVGRNTAPPSKAETGAGGGASATSTDARPQPASGAAPAQNPTPAAAQPPAGETASEPQPATRPAREAEPKPDTPVPAGAVPAETAPAGIFLQVMAVRREEAEVVARSLKDKGFPSSLALAPTGLTRVLVGPYTDAASLGKAKADLENAGFHPIVKK